MVARQRQVLALSEFRVSFSVECSGLQDAERGAADVDYADLDRAAYDAALIENRAVFHGWPEAGITGISPDGYTRVVETTEHGYPWREHLTKILGGDVVWAPGLDGALVVSKRGGDFVLDVGQDLSIGYIRHDAELVTLYPGESFSFRVTEPDAAVVLSDG